MGRDCDWKRNQRTGHCRILLGKAGMKVLVLEKHSTCGGACHTFNDNGYEFNIGVHYVGEMDNPYSPAKIIVDQVSDGQIQWAPLGKQYTNLNSYLIFKCSM